MKNLGSIDIDKISSEVLPSTEKELKNLKKYLKALSKEEKIKILFVCNQGMNRSPTAAILWRDIYDDETMSMGISNPIHDYKQSLKWADRVVVMEDHHIKWMVENYPKDYLRLNPLCLDIPDNYGYMKPDLIELLKKSFLRLRRS